MRRKKNKLQDIPVIPDIDIIDLDDEFGDQPDDIAEEAADDATEDVTDDTTGDAADDMADDDPAPFQEPAPSREADTWLTEDWADAEVESPSGSQKGKSESASSRKIWFVILVVFLIIAAFAVLLYLRSQGKWTNPREDTTGTENMEENHNEADTDETTILDFIVPTPAEAVGAASDDGETVIVTLGNAPLSDDRDSDSGLAQIIADMTGATVYNCSVEGSYLSAKSNVLSSSLTPMDAFNFYWLTTSFCQRNNRYVYQDIFQKLGEDMPAYGDTSYETLQSIDFEKVDIIALMYDAADYLAGHSADGAIDSTDILPFADNMASGIRLIRETYPHIRVIVMSPAYAYAIDESGSPTDSSEYRYAQDTLADFVSAQYDAALACNVTFLDHYHGTVTAENADQYLSDYIHLNEQGRRLIAERFVSVLDGSGPE